MSKHILAALLLAMAPIASADDSNGSLFMGDLRVGLKNTGTQTTVILGMQEPGCVDFQTTGPLVDVSLLALHDSNNPPPVASNLSAGRYRSIVLHYDALGADMVSGGLSPDTTIRGLQLIPSTLDQGDIDFNQSASNMPTAAACNASRGLEMTGAFNQNQVVDWVGPRALHVTLEPDPCMDQVRVILDCN